MASLHTKIAASTMAFCAIGGREDDGFFNDPEFDLTDVVISTLWRSLGTKQNTSLPPNQIRQVFRCCTTKSMIVDPIVAYYRGIDV